MLIEWIMLAFCSVAAFAAFRRIRSHVPDSVADFILVLIYLINCLPILLDLTIGFPAYDPIYWRIQEVLNSPSVRANYAAIILTIMSSLHVYASTQGRHIERRNQQLPHRRSTTHLPTELKILAWCLTLAPYILALSAVGVVGWEALLTYGSLWSRGFPDSTASMITISLLGSVASSCALFFMKQRSMSQFLLFGIHLVGLAWLDGKRYIVLTILLALIFSQVHTRSLSVPAPLRSIALLVLPIAFVSYFLWYSEEYKTTDVESAEGIYATFRLNFGRDDVTKFAISRVIDEDAEPILEYPGQGAAGTALMLVPRSLLADKPYLYYRYLTGAVFDLPQDEIPAGITPSVLAMNVSDWGVVLGTVASIVLLLGISSLADRQTKLFGKLAILLTAVGFLTQSPDAFIIPLAWTLLLIGRQVASPQVTGTKAA